MTGTESQSRPAVLVSGARKTYPAQIGRPAKTVVSDISLQVMPGEIHGLLGPNGAGKTTTLRMLVGLAKATGGTFEVLGKPAALPSGRESLGFLPEQPYFPMQLTGAQGMRLYGRLAGLSSARIAEQTAEFMALVGLETHLDVPLSKYSRGMLQRFGLAQAMLGRPSVYVLDEPASGLDPVGQRDIRNLMLRLRDQGSTILLSSHQLSEIEVVCDRVTIVSRGRVAASGRLDDLLNVAGQTSFRVRGMGDGLPPALEGVLTGVAASGGAWIFSVPDDRVREVVDSIDDAGGRVESVMPKRDSLEDYFARLLAADEGGEAAAATAGVAHGGDAS